MIAPAFQYGINLVFHVLHNFAAQNQYIALALGGYIGADRTLYGAHQGLHQVTLVHKLKGYVLDGLLTLVQYRVQQHGLEMNIGLVNRYGLKFQFYRTVLGRNARVQTLNQWYLKIQARQQDTAVFAKYGDDPDGALLNGDERGKEDNQ